MEITIKFFARFREIIGHNNLTYNFPDGHNVSALVEQLQIDYPALGQHVPQTVISVNRDFADMETELQHGDEVAFFPPVSGGGDDKFAVTYDPISLDVMATKVTHPDCGAVAVFGGMVRNNTAGKAVQHLEYEAYTTMAVEKLEQIAKEARQKWPNIVDIAIVQRIGHLEVGENAVIVAVSCAHRGDGCFEACRYAIDRLKQIVPIWKKEIGLDGSEWIEGDYLPTKTD
ncbi:MoaD family protein [Anaerolineales bacterium HSG24]|nr:MoaD family protein [Anaerolineales bacterium HSG24]